MNCEQARETLLDSLTEPVRAEVHQLMEDHIASCEGCRRFAGVQRTIDARLTAAVPAVSLSPGFRSSLRERLDRGQIPSWPESLPDIAHLAGCALGIVLLLLILPQYAKTVLLAGSAFTVVTYFAQAVVRSSVEQLEPDL
jgi:predicted anti-sigma-YlaC factor YlaD